VRDRAHLPEQIHPIYDFDVAAQQEVLLYEGPLTAQQATTGCETEGRVVFGWHGGVRFEFEAPAATAFELGDVELRISSISLQGRGSISRLNARLGGGRATQEVMGMLQPTTVGGRGDVAQIDFQVVNFPPFVGRPVTSGARSSASRLTLHNETWTVVLDVVPGASDRFKRLQLHGGYGVTLAGRLTPTSGTAFSPNQGENVLHALRVLLSFAAGDWAPPLLPIGIDASGDRVWARWGHPISRPWQGRFHWLSNLHPEVLQEVFRHFMSLWDDDDWRVALGHLVDFYVEANGHTLLEPRLVLAQAGLELLAWLTTSSQNGAASDRIRAMLSKAGVPTGIPDALPTLAAFAGDRDGPWVITDMRNGVVHPPRREGVFEAPREARSEAWSLAMWYLELGILSLLRFQGGYLNRLSARAEWDVDRPPWVVYES
jgi:hypothetical protein